MGSTEAFELIPIVAFAVLFNFGLEYILPSLVVIFDTQVQFMSYIVLAQPVVFFAQRVDACEVWDGRIVQARSEVVHVQAVG